VTQACDNNKINPIQSQLASVSPGRPTDKVKMYTILHRIADASIEAIFMK